MSNFDDDMFNEDEYADDTRDSMVLPLVMH